MGGLLPEVVGRRVGLNGVMGGAQIAMRGEIRC